MEPEAREEIFERAREYSTRPAGWERAGLVVKQGILLTDMLGVSGTEIQQKLRAAEALVRQASGGGGRRWPWRRR
ncbi:hypothetical protein ACFFMR_24050 [Micromonospora andamanensis]|uniref:Uncharacterized protein n=1 Tax=Micromonospora andamanensis TaxID=1287068 RepID=A0ABQ4HTX7_9ACTN|nr:hypothetical protein [Micromonospora andamanensis]GIJ09123.1 hypothetical protein Van01_23370 [Micromonospora andamanensis]